jgi:sensor histidine kinase YesM
MYRRIVLHTGFWITYLILNIYVEVFLINYSFFDLDMKTRILKALVPELLVLPAKLLMAYGIMYFILPRLKRIPAWKISLYLLLITGVSLGLYHFILTGIVYPIVYKEVFPESTLAQDVSRFIWRLLDLLTVVGVACTFKLLRQQTKDARQQKQLVQEKLQSELNFLRAQTNPHFLFNTLNSIYALSRKQSPQAPQVVMQLSKLLRYMIYECKEPTVPLEKEWKIIEDYVELEKLRYGDRVEVKLNRQLNGSEEKIAPLLLLPLVENAFKHGAGKNRDRTVISISLIKEGEVLSFSVENNAVQNENEAEASGGIGLQNVKRQLELLYPDHVMTITDGPGTFSVFIQLRTCHDAPYVFDRRR